MKHIAVIFFSTILLSQSTENEKRIGVVGATSTPKRSKIEYKRITKDSIFAAIGGAEIISAKIPDYPAVAIQKGESGVYEIELHVSPDGTVETAFAKPIDGITSFLKGYSELCAMQWRFKVVEHSIINITFKFELISANNPSSSIGVKYISPGTLVITAKHY